MGGWLRIGDIAHGARTRGETIRSLSYDERVSSRALKYQRNTYEWLDEGDKEHGPRQDGGGLE
jgi:hypothetical protein